MQTDHGNANRSRTNNQPRPICVTRSLCRQLYWISVHHPNCDGLLRRVSSCSSRCGALEFLMKTLKQTLSLSLEAYLLLLLRGKKKRRTHFVGVQVPPLSADSNKEAKSSFKQLVHVDVSRRVAILSLLARRRASTACSADQNGSKTCSHAVTTINFPSLPAT